MEFYILKIVTIKDRINRSIWSIDLIYPAPVAHCMCCTIILHNSWFVPILISKTIPYTQVQHSIIFRTSASSIFTKAWFFLLTYRSGSFKNKNFFLIHQSLLKFKINVLISIKIEIFRVGLVSKMLITYKRLIEDMIVLFLFERIKITV